MVSSLTKNTANILNVLLQIIILVTLRVLGSNRVTIKIKISKSDWYRIKALKYRRTECRTCLIEVIDGYYHR